MNRFRSIVVACLVLAGGSAASASTVTLASPPLASDAAASMIFDALLAIGRATLDQPQRAERGVAPYGAAVQSYAAGDLDGAFKSATAAIIAIDSPYAPAATADSPVVSPPAPAQYPPLVSVSQSESESRLALARAALLNCGATTAAAYTTARPLYDDAVRAVLAHAPNQVNASIQAIVDGCASAIPTVSSTAVTQ